jgi:hypothetical protein
MFRPSAVLDGMTICGVPDYSGTTWFSARMSMASYRFEGCETWTRSFEHPVSRGLSWAMLD